MELEYFKGKLEEQREETLEWQSKYNECAAMLSMRSQELEQTRKENIQLRQRSIKLEERLMRLQEGNDDDEDYPRVPPSRESFATGKDANAFESPVKSSGPFDGFE